MLWVSLESLLYGAVLLHHLQPGRAVAHGHALQKLLQHDDLEGIRVVCLVEVVVQVHLHPRTNRGGPRGGFILEENRVQTGTAGDNDTVG